MMQETEILNEMVYDIVNVQSTHPSFSWANGLYAVIEKIEDENELRMCQLDENFNPCLFEDGSFMVSCTGINNKEVYSTLMKLHFNPKVK